MRWLARLGGALLLLVLLAFGGLWWRLDALAERVIERGASERLGVATVETPEIHLQALGDPGGAGSGQITAEVVRAILTSVATEVPGVPLALAGRLITGLGLSGAAEKLREARARRRRRTQRAARAARPALTPGLSRGRRRRS